MPVISAVQSCVPPTPQDSSDVNSLTVLLPQNDVPSKNTSKLNLFKKKKDQGQGQPLSPNDGSDLLQGDDFPLSQAIADMEYETKPNVR